MAKRKKQPKPEETSDGIFPTPSKNAWAAPEPTAKERKRRLERLQRPLDIESYESELRNFIRPRLEVCDDPLTAEESTLVYLVNLGDGLECYRLCDGLNQCEQEETIDGINCLAALAKVRTLNRDGAVAFAFVAGKVHAYLASRRFNVAVRKQGEVGKAGRATKTAKAEAGYRSILCAVAEKEREMQVGEPGSSTSTTQAREQVAEERGISISTVKAAVRWRKKSGFVLTERN